VLYLLAGFASFGASFLARACFEEAIDQRLARLFANGCPPALVVLPDASTRLGGSQYVNSAALGPYCDYVAREVVDAVDARYRTVRGPAGRAVLGKSSGGFGALHLALEHPGRFGAVACHSGDLGFETSFPPDFPVAAGALERAGGIEPFLDAFFRKPRRTAEDFTTIGVLAMSAACSPRPDGTGFDLPFDPVTCEPRPEVFRRWLAFDPVRRVEGGAAALRALSLLYLDCGSRDEHHLQFGARRIARACRDRDIRVEHEEFESGHRGTSERYDLSIPRLVRALASAARP
jgi:enterochelin esterase family protein